MSVFAITVDGHPDIVVDVDDIDAWCQDANLVHHALHARPVQIAAHARPDLQVFIDSPQFNGAKQMVDHG